MGGRGLTPGSLVPQSPHFGGLPFFLVCWYWSFPPGVLTIRTLLERVLYLVGAHQSPFPEAWGLDMAGLLFAERLTDFSVAAHQER